MIETIINAEMINALRELEQNLVPSKYKDKDWVYRDIPSKLTLKAWDLFTAWIGEGEYIVLCGSIGCDKDGTKWKRGQLIISPKGMDNLRDKERGKILRTEMQMDE